MELICTSGKVETKIGDRYTDRNGEWEIVGYRGQSYSPSSLGDCPNVIVRPIGHDMPSFYQQYANEDGTIDICGDSVAASILDNKDGKSRDARGYLLCYDTSKPRSAV